MKPARIALPFFCLAIGLHGTAQTKTSRALQLSVGVNPGTTTTNWNLALGTDIRLQQAISKNLSWTLTTGYTHFFETHRYHYVGTVFYTDALRKNMGLVPVKAGLQVSVSPALYIGAETGIGFNVGSTPYGLTAMGLHMKKPIAFVYSPYAGINLNGTWSIGVKYEGFTEYDNQLALRVGYHLPNKMVRPKATETAKANPLIWDVAVTPAIRSIHYPVTRSWFAIGAETRLQRRFLNMAAWTASAGVTRISMNGQSSVFLNVKGGVKLYVTPAIYLAGELGMGEFTGGGEWFIYTPSAGVELGKKFDLALRCETYSNFTDYFSLPGLRIGYRLSK